MASASAMREILASELNNSPTTQTPSEDADIDWTFPRPGMRREYDKTVKGHIYELADGIYACHIKVAGEPVVLVSFSKQVPESVINDYDMTYMVAAEVVELSRYMADAVLPMENEYEHRFRTANGKIIGVTLAHDRKTALVRPLQDTER